MTNEEASYLLANADRTNFDEFMNEALDMGIKALEQEPCEDCISRADLISLLIPKIKTRKSTIEIKDKLIPLIKSLNPIQPKIKTEWIPVSERLPEDGRPVLIYAWTVHHVIARYDSFRTENGYKNTWVTADAWNGNTEIKHDVIAWMPLPEPYKTESEDKE